MNHLQASQMAMGGIPSENTGQIDYDGFIRLVALGSVPKIVSGHAIVTMSEVMKGKAVEETEFPEALANTESYTFNGGFYMKQEDVN